jgi:two-component system, OmpR family, response regulator
MEQSMIRHTTRRVLVVDDNRDSVETLSMLLRIKGHDARIADSGEEAIKIADDYQPHVVVLDLSLPGMDGYEVAQRLRERPYGGHMVLVALTGWSGREVQAKAAAAGFDFHLLKPIEWPELEQVLHAEPAATTRGPGN